MEEKKQEIRTPALNRHQNRYRMTAAAMVQVFVSAAFVFAASGTGRTEEVKMDLDAVSVTATRIERKTSQVAASVTVVENETIEDSKQFNIKEVLAGTPGILIESGNAGYDSRLIIRGAGLKAPYGVREIMILRDGVPVTDPDSFTRLDMIDTQLIERVEVVKGPNSTLWGANAAGGVINIISKNPLERSGGTVRAAVGEFGTKNYHISYADSYGENLYYSGSFSRRQTNNSWRRWNKFSTNQVSLQPNFVLSDGSTIETMFTYSEADLQLPGNLDEDMFATYLATGRADETEGPWQFSGRYSESYFVSTKLTKEIGDFQLVPLIYFNVWEHHHPVTGRINDADTVLGGIDLQVNYSHNLYGMQGTLTGGFTARIDNQDTDYFKYLEYDDVPGPSIRITRVKSDKVGSKIEEQSRETKLFGVYAQQSLNITDNSIIDIGLRYDHIDFDIKSIQWGEYNWGQGGYVDFGSVVVTPVEKKYDSISPRIGITHSLNEVFNVFASISSGVQTPTESEITDNANLKMVRVDNYEAGVKARKSKWSFDSSIYYSPVQNEVIKVLQTDGSTEYVNAGETRKKGFEFAGSWQIFSSLTLTGNYSYTDYYFEEFTETVGFGGAARNVDRSGNQLPYVPRHQFSLAARFHHSSGFKASIQSLTWGSYYMDNANTQKYGGYDYITNAMIGYEHEQFELSINVDNLFDKRYANEVTKDTNGSVEYTPAAPQSILARLTLKF